MRVRIISFALASLMATSALADKLCLASPWLTSAEAEEAEPALVSLARWLEPTLDDAPGLAAALEGLRPALCIARRIDGAEGYLDVETRQIVLDGGAASDLQRGILLHELRHLEQFASGFCPANALTMRDNARATFAMEADASAVSLLLAWKRRDDGDASAWDALAAWPQQADIAERLAEELSAGAELPTAAAAAFAQWYAAPDRRESYYLASCSDYLDREDSDHLLRGTATLPDDFLVRLCILPDGRPYPCHEPEFRRK